MNENEVLEKLKGMISEQLGIDENIITKESTFAEDLGADSLDFVELVMGVEENFGIEVPDEAAEKIVTVGDVVKYIVENQ